MFDRHTIAVALISLVAVPRLAASQSAHPTTYGARQALDDRLSVIEQQVVPAADAMPEEKFSYAPIGGAFPGVRTFAEQVKHLAASNWQIGSKILGVEPPAGTHDEAAPSQVRTKAEIMEYVRGSFAILHRAIATVDDENLMAPVSGLTGTWERTRLGLIIDSLAHSSDHYGQMVEYLRANGIVPPASR
jgi:DinB superfamily